MSQIMSKSNVKLADSEKLCIGFIIILKQLHRKSTYNIDSFKKWPISSEPR